MEEIIGLVSGHTSLFAYLIIFAVLFISGLGLPVPEEGTLLTAGFLVYAGYGELYSMMIISFLGVMVGDLTVYFLGRKIGGDIVKAPAFGSFLTAKRLGRGRRYFQKYGNKTIFFARFLTGIRTAVYLAAGAMRMPLKRFFAMDCLAAIISVPLVVFLGDHFGYKIERMILFFHRLNYLILILTIAGIGGVIIFWVLGRRWQQQLQSGKGRSSAETGEGGGGNSPGV